MKLENCKVGIMVKVKSLKKCKKLGLKGFEFDMNFIDKEVIVNAECRKWNGVSFNGSYCAEVKFGERTQTIPIQFLKKIKSTDNINKNDGIDLSSEFIELAKIIKHKKENGENCDDDLRKLSEIMKNDIDNILKDIKELTEEEKLALGY